MGAHEPDGTPRRRTKLGEKTAGRLVETVAGGTSLSTAARRGTGALLRAVWLMCVACRNVSFDPKRLGAIAARSSPSPPLAEFALTVN